MKLDVSSQADDLSLGDPIFFYHFYYNVVSPTDELSLADVVSLSDPYSLSHWVINSVRSLSFGQSDSYRCVHQSDAVVVIEVKLSYIYLYVI